MNLRNSQRVVIKIGSSAVFDVGKKQINRAWLDSFAKDLSRLQKIEIYPIIFCSGAVAAGKAFLPEADNFDKLLRFKLAGAMGQHLLNEAWCKALADNNLFCVPMIFSTFDFGNSNAEEVLLSLRLLKKIPLLNENIPFQNKHNNDYHASMVAEKVKADHFIMLTDTDGLFDKNPKLYADAKQISVIRCDEQLHIQTQMDKLTIGTGGAISKLQCGLHAASLGIETSIINGTVDFPISQVIEGKRPYTTIVNGG